MAQGYDANSIFGRSFDTVVNSQLALRSDIVSAPTRTNEQIQYLNGRSAFVKLTSSVNIAGSSDPAKNNILFGGILYNKDGVSEQRFGLSRDGNEKAAYTYSDAQGYRPMPGIDSISVDSKNTFGTLRVAKVNFKCWSIEQLNELEKLYLRPGFSVLLEWGNTFYFGKNSVDYVTSPKTLTEFLGTDKELTKSAIYGAIKSLKASSYGNYDAMFGLIRNFQWSYRLDGGYDCTCDIVSIGELSEGLSVILSLGQTEEETNSGSPPGYEGIADYNKSSIHRFIKTIKDIREGFILNQPGFSYAEAVLIEYNTELQKRIETGLLFNSLQTYTRFLNEVGANKFKVLNCKITTGENGYLRYIRLRDLLAVVNTLMLKSPKETIVRFNLERVKSRYRTFSKHFALDPGVCVLPKVIENDPYYGLQKTAKDLLAEESDISNSILDIFLELDFILEHLNSLYESSGITNRSLATFITGILGDIQVNLGDINDLDYVFDEDAGEYFIIDRNLTPNKSNISSSIINVTGLKSMVTNFSLTSKIPPNLAAMVAISAQATSTDIGLEMENLTKWNRGLTDRVFKQKHISSGKKTADERTQAEYKALLEVIKNFNTQVDDKYTYEQDTISSFKSSHQFYCKHTVQNESEEFGAAGIIPFELSITMDGISGLKITEVFKINKGILPSQYDRNAGFIITGLNHSVQNNKWETTINAQLIII